MATFTQDELEFIRTHGNTECAKTWLGLWNVSDAKRSRGPQQTQDQREHIIDKYEKQRYYLQPASPLKSIGAAASVGGLRNGSSNGSSAGSTTNSSSHPSSPASSSAASVTSDNNNNIQNQLNLKAIQLTPPASTRTSGRHHHHHQQQQQQQNHHVLNNNNLVASSRLQNNNSSGTTNSNHQNGGSNANAFGEDSLFSQEASQQQVPQQQQLQQPWANLNSNANSLFETVGRVGGASPGLKLTNNSHQTTTSATAGMSHSTMMTARPVAGQGATGIGGFIADFGSADIIFNGNVISGQNGFASNVNGNGYPGKAVVGRGGGGNGLVADKLNGNVQNGAFGTRKQEENFADFEHNPIFNSAGEFKLERRWR